MQRKEKSSTPVIDIRDLSVEFPTPRGSVKALRHIFLSVYPGEIVGLVGESGSGKSAIATMTLRLIPSGQVRHTSGNILVLGRDIMALPAADLEAMRGSEIAMVFQEPMNALNPTIRVGEQLITVIRRHQGLNKDAARRRALDLLKDMQVDDAARVMENYPHMLSGGMRQRVLIAMAFSCEPKVLIADEPTTALDVLVQAEILRLIWRKARELNTAVLFISHDMATVHRLCDRLYVLYAGEVVESGVTDEVLNYPAHPYTRALLAAMPAGYAAKTDLEAIEGMAPSLLDPPSGCCFKNRCAEADEKCLEKPPMAILASDGKNQHGSACWRVLERGGL